MAKPRKAHGGRRSNAGRKPLLSLGERLEVGSICEKKWDDLAREAAESRLDKRAEADGIREEQGRLQKIQEQWGRSAAGRKSYAAEVLSVAEILEEVSAEIDEIVKGRGASRMFSVPLRRPQRSKDRVLQEVSELTTAATGKQISKRMVKTCWDEFRSLHRALKSEPS